MIEKLDNAVFYNYDIVFVDIDDSDIVTFFRNGIGLNSINLNDIDLNDDNFDDCDPKTINHIRLKQSKACKKNKQSISAWSMTSNKMV